MFVLAVCGLVMTWIGVELMLAGFLLTISEPPTPPNAHPYMRGLPFLIGLVLGGYTEVFGAVPVLCSCAVGLRQTLRRRPAWFGILFVGALVPLLGAAAVVVLAYAAEDQFGQLAPSVRGVSLLLLGAVIAPVVAALVATAYAVSTLRVASAATPPSELSRTANAN